MRTAPPLRRFLQFPVTAGIGLMAIAVTIVWLSSKQSVDALTMNVLAFEGEPWRLVTSALPHLDVLHLLFNLMWLWVFGSVIEETWGPVRTFAIFVLMEVPATLGEYALFHGGVGLSGIVYGLWGLLAVISRRDPRFLGIVTQRTNMWFVGWFVLCVVMTAANVMSIGNVAHGVGAVMGALLGLALSARALVARIAAGAAMAAVIAATWLGADLFRPQVNLSKYGGSDSALVGYGLLQTDPKEAIRHLRHALVLSPNEASSWYNLGGALETIGSPDESLVALRRAYALDPSDDQYRKRLANVLAGRAVERSKAADYAAAILLYRESVVIIEHWSTWFNLSLALAASNDHAGAVAAARRAHQLQPSPETQQWLLDSQERARMGTLPVTHPTSGSAAP